MASAEKYGARTSIDLTGTAEITTSTNHLGEFISIPDVDAELESIRATYLLDGMTNFALQLRTMHVTERHAGETPPGTDVEAQLVDSALAPWQVTLTAAGATVVDITLVGALGEDVSPGGPKRIAINVFANGTVGANSRVKIDFFFKRSGRS